MESRRLKFSEDHQSHSTLGSHSEPIPIDLMIEIFLRLPAKSIARFRCLSKIWSCIFSRPDFTELFFTKSSARPQLLFASYKNSELLFFSSHPDEKQSHIATNFQIKFPFVNVYDIFSPINGLVCIRGRRIIKGTEIPVDVLVICNPSTGQSITLPKRTRMEWNSIRSFFGYDPVEKQFKVLSMIWSSLRDNGICKEHQVLTLGTEKLSWRPVKCGIPPHCPERYGVCINGILYYSAETTTRRPIIVCFDVRSENFSFIEITEPFYRAVHPASTLFNYKGKLATIMSEWFQRVEMWVLEDPKTHQWTKHIYDLSLLQNDFLYVVGVTATTNEIVLSPRFHNESGHFYVFYCNVDRKTTRRVEIQGMETFKGKRVYTLVDHVEDVKLMKVF